MRRIRFAPFLSIALFLVLPVWAQEKSLPTPTSSVNPSSEVRALWVVFTTLTSTEKIRKMVESAKAAGFNTIIVQVRGRGDAYYRSRWEPRPVELKDQPPDFDPLQVVLAEAKRRGPKVHTWLKPRFLAHSTGPPVVPAN